MLREAKGPWHKGSSCLNQHIWQFRQLDSIDLHVAPENHFLVNQFRYGSLTLSSSINGWTSNGGRQLPLRCRQGSC
jgi:hypothetical protein